MKICKYYILFVFCFFLAFTGCESRHDTFTGKFIDEYENKFELRADHSATVQFAGMDPFETTWSEGEKDGLKYATIAFNGDDAYFYLCNNALYRHFENIKAKRQAIHIEWEE